MVDRESQRPRRAPSASFKAGLAAAAFVAPVVFFAGRAGDPSISLLCGLAGGAIAVPVSALIDRHARTGPGATRTYGLGLGLAVMAAGFVLILLLGGDIRAAFYFGGWYAGTAELAEIWFALRRRHARRAAGMAEAPSPPL